MNTNRVFLVAAALALTSMQAGAAPSFALAPEAGKSYLLVEKSALHFKSLTPIVDQKPIRKVWKSVKNVTAKDLQALTVEVNKDGATYSHAIPTLEVGQMKKTEVFQVKDAPNVGIQTQARLAFGDTITVTAGAGQGAADARVVITRTMGGTGDASARAHYLASSRTLVNGLELPSLNYSLYKAPDGKDQNLGETTAKDEIVVKVGEAFVLEGSLAIVDGIEAAPQNATEYIKDGSDSVAYTITVTTPGVCLKSASGTFQAGDCK